MSDQKKRHGCLTALLVLMMVANSATALLYLVGGSLIRKNMPAIPPWAIVILGVFSLFNLLCSVALYKWKKWGFWGFVVSSVVALILNLYLGLGIVQSLMGLIGIVLLFIVLQIGNENKGWPQLD